MKPPVKKPVVKLIGTAADGNAFAIMGKVKQALKRAGASEELIQQYITEATSGDYDHLLAVTMGYVDIQ